MDGKQVLTTILLIEDNEDHALLVRKALQGNGLANEIHTCSTGEEALDYLLQRGEFTEKGAAPRPGLILLDIKLPGIDGIEVLTEIKKNTDLRLIPVIMLTTSAQDSDLVASYLNGVNSYIQKPVDFGKFVETVRNVGLYWLLTNVAPPSAV
jgi:two-component system, response regulator